MPKFKTKAEYERLAQLNKQPSLAMQMFKMSWSDLIFKVVLYVLVFGPFIAILAPIWLICAFMEFITWIDEEIK